MTDTTDTLNLCEDCYYTAHMGWDVTHIGRPLPDPAPLNLVPDGTLVGFAVVDPATGKESDPHYSKRPCEGCGDRHEGNRHEVNVTYRS